MNIALHSHSITLSILFYMSWIQKIKETAVRCAIVLSAVVGCQVLASAQAGCDMAGTSISFSTTGNNTASGFITTHLLTDGAGVIIQTVTSPFNAPATAAAYKVYTINYDNATGIPPTLTAGTNIAAIGGTCVVTNTTPLTFTVCAAVNIIGTVFDDGNGLLGDNTVNGTGTNAGNTLYANLISGGVVLQSVPVAANGTYTFTGVAPNASYTVLIATSNAATAASLPSGWANTGDNIGVGAGSDGTPNGTLTVTVGTSDVTAVNFGIDQTPTAATLTQSGQINPGGTAQATVAATTFGSTDADGTTASLTIMSFPSNATSIVVNGTSYTSSNFPVGGIIVPTATNGQPTQAITIDPIDGAVNVVINYITTDNAGKTGTAGTATVPFSAPPATINIAGTVFNDANGLTDATINGTGTNAGGTLYANLINGGAVVQSVLIAANGTYTFLNVAANTTYDVVLTTSATATGAALPSGYTNTGEGTATAGDGTPNGVTTIAVNTTTVTGVNFGIKPACEAPASAFAFSVTGNNTSSGYVTVSVLTDAAGVILQTVTSPFNTPNAAAIYNVYTINYDGATGTAPTLIAGTNISAIGGTCVAVGAPISFEVCGISIAGNVFHDAGGLLTDNTVNGTGTNVANALYANLISGGIVVQSVLVAADGSYNFPNVAPNTNYTVIVATSGTATTPNLPTGWVNTGEHIGTAAGSDGTVNGSIAVSTTNADIVDVNFGIEIPPTANNLTDTPQPNPNGAVQAPVSATTFGGADTDGTVTSIVLLSFPTNATSIVVNGITYYPNAGAIPSGAVGALVFPTNGITIPTNASGQPTQTITVDPIDGAVSVVIPYATVDNAGVQSVGATATVPFTSSTVSIAGNVFHDAGGLLTDNTVNGTGTNVSNALYANLISGGTVIASVAIATDGSYSFANVASNTNYTIIIATSGTATTPTLPTGWVNTGENIGTASGSDGTVNGSIAVAVATSNITNINFGIEQPPSAGNITQATQPNPNGTTQATVAATTFSGTDPDGTVTSIKITAFPTNATSIVIDGVSYTAANFPIGGVVVPANTSGEPTQTITVDPVDGAVSVVIPYVTIDNAGFASAAGTATVPFSAGLGSIGDFVWNDTTPNGIQDAGEIGIASIEVVLYNAMTGAVVAATRTDAYGHYLFAGLGAGSYQVGFTLPNGYVFSTQGTGTDSGTATDSDVNTNTGRTRTVALAAGENDLNVDAGVHFAPISLTANVTGTAWFDGSFATSNGIQSAVEKGLAGVTVTLYSSSGVAVATTLTDATGAYMFSDVTVGTYSVGFTPPSGMVFTTQTAGTADGSDANPSTGRTATFLVTAGTTAGDIDAGLKQPNNSAANRAALGATVWNDTNNDGLRDANEVGVAGVTVTLYSTDGVTVIATTTTDAFGHYIFNDLPAGGYRVGFTNIPSGFNFVARDAGGAAADSRDSDVNPNASSPSFGLTAIVTLADGEQNLTVDAGIRSSSLPNGSIGDYVWFDSNQNGVQDATESGVGGITVRLYDVTGTTLIATTTTNGRGFYTFPNLGVADYTIQFSNLPVGYTFTALDATTNGGTDSNDNDANANGWTGVIALAANENRTSVDAGIYPSGIAATTASLGNFVWYDTNNDGIQAATEVGVSGVTVNLYNANNTTTPIATTTTDANGQYMFTGLAAGNYKVGFAPSSLPSGYAFAPQNSSAGSATDANDSDANTTTGLSDLIVLHNGETNPTIDAGIYNITAPIGSIGNFVWYDTDSNGAQDAGEPGVAGITVTLIATATGNAIRTTTTNAQGGYLFPDLPFGTYNVVFNNLPNGFSFTTANATTGGANDANDNDAVPNAAGTSGITADIIISSTTPTDLTVDAGLITTTRAALGNYVWFDTNGDGIQNSNEKGLAGVTVVLYDATATTRIASVVTDANGYYIFNNLLADTYVLGFENLPAGTSIVPQNASGSTAANDSDVNPNGFTDPITLMAGDYNMDIDAGITIHKAAVSGYAWYDTNGATPNGIHETTETGVAGVVVELRDATTNAIIATTVTDATGLYTFANLDMGSYYITFNKSSLPNDFAFVTPDLTTDDLDSDANTTTGVTPTFTLAAGETRTGIDAGIDMKASIGDFVWLDTNKDGVQDVGEAGIGGVTVNLYRSAAPTVIVASMVTRADGSYGFNNLNPDDYFVAFVAPSGYTATAATVGTDDGSDAALTNGQTPMQALARAAHSSTLDAGFFPEPLPVTLLYFNSKEGNCTVNLNWATASERNAAAFRVERSVDGIRWAALGTVRAAGNSTTLRFYTFVDAKPVRNNYYRLVQIDADGRTETFRLAQSVTTNGCYDATTNGISGLYPNPNNTDNVTVKFYTDRGAEEVTMQVYDALGQIVTETKLGIDNGSNVVKVDIADLPAGTYLLKIVGDGWYSVAQRLVRIK